MFEEPPAILKNVKNRKSFWEWVRKNTTAETPPYFKVGEGVKIYMRPIQQEGFEGIAELVEFVNDNYDYPGLQGERWKVRFDNELPLHERIIFKDTSLLLSRRTKMFEESSDVPKNLNGNGRTGLDAGADV